MKKILFIVIAVMLFSLSACTNSNKGENDTETYAMEQSPAPSDDESFIWNPVQSSSFGSDACNRLGFGIIDIKDGIYYYQSECNEDCLYALYSYDSKTGEKRLLANDCYGMINASDKSLFYIGYMEKGLYRYDYAMDTSEKIYSGDVANIVSAENHIYFITGDNVLYQIDPYSGDRSMIMENVASDYLDLVGNVVYFARLNDNQLFDLYRVNVGAPQGAKCILESIPYPIKNLGKDIVCRDSDDVFLVNIENGAQSTVISDCKESFVAANGNGIFYTQTDSDGYSEISAYNMDTGKISNLMPVHCTTIYFMDNELYLVDIVNFKVEKAILNPNGNSLTEWIIK